MNDIQLQRKNLILQCSDDTRLFYYLLTLHLKLKNFHNSAKKLQNNLYQIKKATTRTTQQQQLH